MLPLLLCAALESFLDPSPCVKLTLDCENLTQPVLVIFEAYSCGGGLCDWRAFRGCPPDVLLWCPSCPGPYRVEAHVYSGPNRTEQTYNLSDCP